MFDENEQNRAEMNDTILRYGLKPKPAAPPPEEQPHYRSVSGFYEPDVTGAALPERKKERGGFKKMLQVIAFGVLFGLFAGLAFWGVTAVTGADRAAPALSGTVETVKSLEEILTPAPAVGQPVLTGTYTAVVTDVTDVVEKVMPAVVSINGQYTSGGFYSYEQTGTGSGIIVGENETELLVVTNYHVVEDALKLSVVFVDGEEVEAQVKGTDPSMDLAVIALPLDAILNSTKDAIHIATLGDSDALKVGEPAIAIGNALGYGQSVTTGVVSALSRELEIDNGSTATLIQTDAAINPGNSGGALLNVKGEVIGINSNKIGGAYVEGMGYAIPISAARPIIENLMTKETRIRVAEAERGFLGISGVNVTEEVSQTYRLPVGIYITQVHEGAAAERSDITYLARLPLFNPDGTVKN